MIDPDTEEEPQAVGILSEQEPAKRDSGTLSSPIRADVHPRPPGGADFLLHRILAGTDLAAISIAAVVAVLYVAGTNRPVDVSLYLTTFVLMIPVWYAIAFGSGLYHEVGRRFDLNSVDGVGTIVIASTAWCWLFVMLRALIVSGGTDLLAPALMWLLMIPLLILFRAAARHLAKKRPWYRRAIAVVGESSGVSSLVERIDRHAEWGLEVELEIVFDPQDRVTLLQRSDRSEGEGPSNRPDGEVEPTAGGYRIVSEGIEGSEEELGRLLEDAGINRAIIAGGAQGLNYRNRLVQEFLERGIGVDQVSGGAETLCRSAVFHDLEGLPVLSVRPSPPTPVDRRVKRLVDIAISSAGLVLTSPILLAAAIWIKLDSKGPVFYRQIRCGLDRREFELVKLRTMFEDSHEKRPELRQATLGEGNDDVLFKLDADPRVTRAGRFLRRTSIDELPQLWNVLKGDMSIVGPRPLVFEEAMEAKGVFSARTRMKPGVTGPWQVLGRSSIPFEDMIRLDYAYIMGWSASEDIRLILRTLSSIINRQGAL